MNRKIQQYSMPSLIKRASEYVSHFFKKNNGKENIEAISTAAISRNFWKLSNKLFSWWWILRLLPSPILIAHLPSNSFWDKKSLGRKKSTPKWLSFMYHMHVQLVSRACKVTRNQKGIALKVRWSHTPIQENFIYKKQGPSLISLVRATWIFSKAKTLKKIDLSLDFGDNPIYRF